MKSLMLVLALIPLSMQSPASEQGFVPLFNGKDFTGWKISNPASFKIENGGIVANGTAGHAYYDGQVGKTFRNFELKIDVMTKPNSNGGVYVMPLDSAQSQGASTAQAPAPAAGQGRGNQPAQPMTFFVTSVGLGKGANLGGLAGADAHCQALATAVGAGGRQWRAYLSTQGPNAVNARDRIGKGPWHNVKGASVARDLEHLHGDTIDLARMGNTLTRVTALSEKGEPIKGAGDTPNQHDILTGSQLDGRAFTDGADHTCNNWTSDGTGTAQVGHHDRTGGPGVSWNSVHASKGCSQENLVGTGGAGLLYCFSPGTAGQ